MNAGVESFGGGRDGGKRNALRPALRSSEARASFGWWLTFGSTDSQQQQRALTALPTEQQNYGGHQVVCGGLSETATQAVVKALAAGPGHGKHSPSIFR